MTSQAKLRKEDMRTQTFTSGSQTLQETLLRLLLKHQLPDALGLS